MTDQVVSTRIEWVREHCRLLRAISAEFRQTRPFDGLTIGTGIHLEAKTVALLLTLRDGGARLVSTGNLNTTQPDAVAVLRAEGITVVGGPTSDSEVHARYLGEVLAAKPDLILELVDGRRVHLLARGHMFNLAGPRPLGNSIASMDLGFALQARCLEAVATGSVDATSCVVPVPGEIDTAIAISYLDGKYPPAPR